MHTLFRLKYLPLLFFNFKRSALTKDKMPAITGVEAEVPSLY